MNSLALSSDYVQSSSIGTNPQMRFHSLAAVVVLFQPNIEQTIKNIESYISETDCLYVVDNGGGGTVLRELSKRYPRSSKIFLLHRGRNIGLGAAYNKALRKSFGNHTHLMTMDQDSQFCEQSMLRFREYLSQVDWTHTLCVGPKKTTKNDVECIPESTGFHAVERWKGTISSGMVVDIAHALEIGGFNEDYFIDEVDHEFCIRGNEHQLKSLELSSGAWLLHKIGTPIEKSFMGIRIRSFNHSAERKYYIIRNRLCTYRNHYRYRPIKMFNCYIIGTLRMLLALVLIEDNKTKKLRFCAKGFSDFIHKK